MKKTVSLILSAVILISVCGFNSFAVKKIQSLRIVTMPSKTEFVKDKDWVYGLWNINESTKTVTKIESSKISFTHNAGGGIYPERGMIDMTGLQLEVTYTDGTKSTIAYKESLNATGFYSANILASPKGGKDYFIGTNTIEVYLDADHSKYASYDIKITGDGTNPPSLSKGDIDGNGAINSGDALLVLQHSVKLITLNSSQQKAADMNNDSKINSSDALAILMIAVNKK